MAIRIHKADEEFTLLEKIGLAGFPNGLGNIQHGLVRRQILGLHILHDTENQTDQADNQANIKNGHTRQGSHPKS